MHEFRLIWLDLGLIMRHCLNVEAQPHVSLLIHLLSLLLLLITHPGRFGHLSLLELLIFLSFLFALKVKRRHRFKSNTLLIHLGESVQDMDPLVTVVSCWCI